MKKILAVDDDPGILQTLTVALGHKGYQVTVTTAPTEVESLVTHTRYDLVILDVRMPVKSGIEVFDELKKKNPGLRYLFITAFLKSFAVDSEKMLAMWQQEFADGETDVLYKPFTLDILYEKVEGLIGPARG